MIIDDAEFSRRLEYVGTIATMMKRTLDVLCQLGYCTQKDADSLCVSDDTAAWLCGRLQKCNFVSFRVHINRFQHPNPGLEYFKFEESLSQREHVGVRYTYMNYSLFKNVVALRLVVYTRTLRKNMYADGLPYFVQNFLQTSYKHVGVYVRNHCAIPMMSLPVHEQLIENTIDELLD
ncbi:lef-12 protein [Thysanoplusia orichalcea nucleopolyhedrovirus]|uniref:Lef-12 protein n=1 Tax=Thysanoplusia orichalcea nucleopolyhedrovirus TaxID=101850 RepID=L0CL69_9ABAC|nr:lef-12 protein [Thysanoplusia orichalcea nucleopolyhedrovirus]AGA16195.1 lef-12 protein [Thysanoplusia orichalcea nucleopolyhedrovirus]